jgi:hypothetical protein
MCYQQLIVYILWYLWKPLGKKIEKCINENKIIRHVQSAKTNWCYYTVKPSTKLNFPALYKQVVKLDVKRSWH